MLDCKMYAGCCGEVICQCETVAGMPLGYHCRWPTMRSQTETPRRQVRGTQSDSQSLSFPKGQGQTHGRKGLERLAMNVRGDRLSSWTEKAVKWIAQDADV